VGEIADWIAGIRKVKKGLTLVMSLKVRLFGKFRVENGEQRTEGLDSGKPQELFCYLLLHRTQNHNRETLAGTLWESSSTSQSKKYLRQTIWQLQNILQNGEISFKPPLLIIESDWIRINPEANLWLDVAEFEKIYSNVHGLQGWELDAGTIQSLDYAVELYRDDLLLGWYQDWALFERERLQNMFLSILDKLMVYCEAHGKYETGINYGMRILTFDCARERTHQSLIRLYYLSGDRTSALRQYMRCEKALLEELGVGPAKSTMNLYEIVKTDDKIDPHFNPTTLPEKLITPEPLKLLIPNVVGQLKEIHWFLANAQQRVQNDIEALEQALKGQT
jgi:DNA-binding SARP family transcriptional activator